MLTSSVEHLPNLLHRINCNKRALLQSHLIYITTLSFCIPDTKTWVARKSHSVTYFQYLDYVKLQFQHLQPNEHTCNLCNFLHYKTLHTLLETRQRWVNHLTFWPCQSIRDQLTLNHHSNCTNYISIIHDTSRQHNIIKPRPSSSPLLNERDGICSMGTLSQHSNSSRHLFWESQFVYSRPLIELFSCMKEMLYVPWGHCRNTKTLAVIFLRIATWALDRIILMHGVCCSRWVWQCYEVRP